MLSSALFKIFFVEVRGFICKFVRFLSRPHFHLLSGLNLPLIIDLLISAAEDDTEKLITEALTNAKESIQYCNQTIASAMTMDKDF